MISCFYGMRIVFSFPLVGSFQLSGVDLFLDKLPRLSGGVYGA